MKHIFPWLLGAILASGYVYLASVCLDWIKIHGTENLSIAVFAFFFVFGIGCLATIINKYA